MPPRDPFLAIVNPAAGGGRCGRLAAPALDRLRAAGLALEVATSERPWHTMELARAAYARGIRRFIAVGGDGTSCEIVNGVFPESASGDRVTLGFLPLGTGNSFLREFTPGGADAAAAALLAGRSRPCDVLRLRHAGGTLYFINLLSMGFTADVAALVNRRFKRLGELGYLLGVLFSVARLRRRAFPLRADGAAEFDRRRCLFLVFGNSKFTGGKMMIAPDADTASGRIEYVRWGPIGRLGLLRNLPGLYDGSHIRHPLASRAAVERIEFDLDAPVDVMMDGESLTLACRSLEVLPGALEVLV